MPPLAFELTISAGKLPQTYALDRAATGTGIQKHIPTKYISRGIRRSGFLIERHKACKTMHALKPCYEDVCRTGRKAQRISNSDTAATLK